MEALLLFLAIVFIANVFDKKKPRATRIPMPQKTEPRPPTPARLKKNKASTGKAEADGRREKNPDAYEQEPAYANPYQEFLNRRPEAKEAYAAECEAPYEGHREHEHSRYGNTLTAPGSTPLAQAIIMAEILDKPKALRRNRRCRY